MGSDDQALQAFIERATELDQQRDARLGEDDIREIAQAVGLSDEALDNARASGQASLERGRQYVDHQVWNDAISELRDAVVLLPGNVEARGLLARAYGGRFLRDRDGNDRNAAVRLAHQCTEVAPNYAPAYDLLDELDGPGARSQQQNVTMMLIGVGVTVLALVGFLLFAMFAGGG